MIGFYFLIWYLVGICSFIYWWTKDHDFDMSLIFICFIEALFGPFTFLFGWLIHGDHSKRKIKQPVSVKKRGK